MQNRSQTYFIDRSLYYASIPDLEHDPGWRLDKRSADMEENGLRFRYEEYVPVKGE